MNKGSLKQRLFIIVLLIVLVNFVVLTLFGSALFQKFYYKEKEWELRENAVKILNSLDGLEEETWMQEGEEQRQLFRLIQSIEKQNNSVMIFTLDDEGESEVLYHTWARFRQQGMEETTEKTEAEPETAPPPPGTLFSEVHEAESQSLEKMRSKQERTKFSFPLSRVSIGQWILDDPPEPGKIVVMENSSPDGRSGSIVLAAGVRPNIYLLLETPKDYLALVARRAVQYTAILSAVIFLFGSVVVYFLVEHFTRPISEVRETAERIAHLDFSKRCKAESQDELGLLAKSINQMADQLEHSIEALKESNQTLQTDLESQKQTDRIRREFISNVSHDFKTPITLVVSYAEALKTAEDPAQRSEYCDILIEEGNRLSSIIGRMLQLSKLECGMNPLNPSVFCLNEILNDAIHQQKIMAEKKNQTIETDYCDEVIVRADFQQIQQAFANILENAIKYAGEGRKIRVSTHLTENNLCRVEVCNEGSYIPPDDLPRIFGSFYRADKTREHTSQSYGIGLAIVKAILEQHGQQYGAYNTDSGVCFWFTLETVVFEDEEDSDAEE